eukprot:CAMPEP_0197500904 /NCGR_PEP_ID=MMETSP1312-20131121/210_1 /TAXON_ID=464262 /ORGANISM="Genus nov. species nov., Strain RCC2335" /LENGTH=55 /DNA_ID=CAMNT_0043046687 /DNA_START=161 /DNA_END=325 /DNA_ORIENTATION=+
MAISTPSNGSTSKRIRATGKILGTATMTATCIGNYKLFPHSSLVAIRSQACDALP